MNNFILIAAALVSAAVAQADWHAGNMPNGWVEEDCGCDQHHHLEHKPHHHDHHEHHHEHHEHEHKPHHHDHHHMRTRSRFNSFSSEAVLPIVDLVKPAAAQVAPAGVEPVIVVVQENSPVYTVDPNGQGPYPNGLTMDIFTSCNDNKGFIAKRGDGIYTEVYSLKAAGQSKPVFKN